MKQKHNHFILNRYTVSVLVFLVIAAVSTLVITERSHTDATPSVKPGIGAAVRSKFSSTGTVGWWQGATNETSMALFQNTHDCFVSTQFNAGTVDVAAELQKAQTDQASGNTSTPGVVLSLTLQTNTGEQQYRLHQYSISNNSGQSLMLGLELGYLQLPGGYIKVEGHCNTADELSATTPALQTVKFNVNN